MSKLLHKPLKVFTLYALIILCCSIPVYYVIVDSIWLEELDDHNELVKEQTEKGLNELHQNVLELQKTIHLWNRIQPSTRIMPTSSTSREDSVYTIVRMITDDGALESERFRGLLSYIKIGETNYRLAVETNVEEADETVSAISMITVVFIVLLIVGFIILNKRLSRQIWKPFADTLEKLKKFDLNNATTLEFAKTDIQEFIELNAVLSNLIDNSIKTFTQQKEFAQNASHELQTPLALLKSKLDLLVQDTSLTHQQREIIEALNSSVSRVGRINKNLLLLAGIENKVYTSESIFVGDLLHTVLGGFKDYAVANEMTITEDITNSLTVITNESLLEILLSNIVSNAIRHGDRGSYIKVELNETQLNIKNSGSQALKNDHLFQRFRSVSSQVPGTGLGLAIVKEICDKYAWKVSYRFSEGEHCFTVKF